MKALEIEIKVTVLHDEPSVERDTLEGFRSRKEVANRAASTVRNAIFKAVAPDNSCLLVLEKHERDVYIDAV